MTGITEAPINNKFTAKSPTFLVGKVNIAIEIDNNDDIVIIRRTFRYLAVRSRINPNMNDPTTPLIMKIAPKIELSTEVYPYGSVIELTTDPREV